MAQKELWDTAKRRSLQDRRGGARRGREHKAMHGDKFLSSWLGDEERRKDREEEQKV